MQACEPQSAIPRGSLVRMETRAISKSSIGHSKPR